MHRVCFGGYIGHYEPGYCLWVFAGEQHGYFPAHRMSENRCPAESVGAQIFNHVTCHVFQPHIRAVKAAAVSAHVQKMYFHALSGPHSGQRVPVVQQSEKPVQDYQGLSASRYL